MRGLASEVATDFWRHRFDEAGYDVAARYRRSVAQAHRGVILDALEHCQPWQRLHELGCHIGPNLARVRERFPDAVCTGCDVDAAAIGEAKAWFDDDPSVTVWQSDLFDDLNAPYWPIKPDVLLTCYTLAYVHPEDIAVVIRRLVQEAQRAIVLAEPMQRGPGRLTHGVFHEWAHDYGVLLGAAVHEAGRTATAFVSHVDPPVNYLNAVLTCVFKEPLACLDPPFPLP